MDAIMAAHVNFPIIEVPEEVDEQIERAKAVIGTGENKQVEAESAVRPVENCRSQFEAAREAPFTSLGTSYPMSHKHLI